MSKDQSSADGINDITNAVQSLLQKTLTDLKDNAAAKGPGEPRLFFPNGIELISVVVRLTPPDVEVTIAGEKGIKPKESRSLKTARVFADSHMDVWASENTEDIFRNGAIIWYNDGNTNVDIAFNTPDGCPFIPAQCSFTVKKGEILRTVVLNTIDAGEYHFTRTPRHILDNPKIIIQ